MCGGSQDGWGSAWKRNALRGAGVGRGAAAVRDVARVIARRFCATGGTALSRDVGEGFFRSRGGASGLPPADGAAVRSERFYLQRTGQKLSADFLRAGAADSREIRRARAPLGDRGFRGGHGSGFRSYFLPG